MVAPVVLAHQVVLALRVPQPIPRLGPVRLAALPPAAPLVPVRLARLVLVAVPQPRRVVPVVRVAPGVPVQAQPAMVRRAQRVEREGHQAWRKIPRVLVVPVAALHMVVQPLAMQRQVTEVTAAQAAAVLLAAQVAVEVPLPQAQVLAARVRLALADRVARIKSMPVRSICQTR